MGCGSIQGEHPQTNVTLKGKIIFGGGNFANGKVTSLEIAQFKALQTVGAKMCRFALYPHVYFDEKKRQPTPALIDKAMAESFRFGITPVFLFEYYGYYSDSAKTDPPIPSGDKQKWFSIGQAFAKRFQPNGEWAKENGIRDWGVTVFAAINEPDADESKNNRIPFEAYRDALEGLADGVHSINSELKVLPGGFASANAYSDFTLRGYGSAIASLFNQGKLDGIDLHTYYDVQWAPLEGTYKHSAQYNFDQIKLASGITADINFYCTEFNYSKRGVDDALMSEEEAAKGFLTGIWDNLGVVKNDGATPATQFAFPWNIFLTVDEYPHYGLSKRLEPWTPTASGRVLQMVVELTKGMSFESLDPKRTGEFVLRGKGKKLWIWQNRSYWTNHAGSSFILKNIPHGTTKIEIYGWNGLRQTIQISKQNSYTINNLASEETLMFLAKAD
jgi:hypothetical protein